jgi:S-methylmethionine-dependent homocysteine/selenocysteine methylase
MEAESVLLAGGISYCSWSGDHPSLDELQRNAQLVGGCCGSGVAHTAALRESRRIGSR